MLGLNSWHYIKMSLELDRTRPNIGCLEQKMSIYKNYFLFPLFLLLVACQTTPVLQSNAQTETPKETQEVKETVKLPFSSKVIQPDSLDKEMLFHYLAGQISAQRGDFHQAYTHYFEAAKQVKDEFSAERATRLALFINDNDAALKAVQYWIAIAPNNIIARQLGALLYVRVGEQKQALLQLEALLKIAQAKGANGFTQAATALVKEIANKNTLQLMKVFAARHSSDPHAFYALALVEVAAEELLMAESSLRKAIQLDPAEAKTYILLGQVLSTQGKFDESVQLLESALDDLAESRLLRMSYARTLVSKKAYKAAFRQFKLLHAKDEKDQNGLYLLGVLAVQIQNWDEARGVWQQLRTTQKHYNEASYFLGQVEEVTGNIDLARGLYRSVKGGRLLTDAKIHLARLEAHDGNVSLAQEILEESRQKDPKRATEIYTAEANMLQENDLEVEAFALYLKAIEDFPEDLSLRYGRGLLAANTENLKMMEADFQFVIDNDPKHVDALNALGYTLADKTDRFDEALTYVERANVLSPGSPAILDSLGWIYYRLGNYDKALVLLRKALTMVADAEISAHFGEVLWVTGEKEAAKKVWEAALKSAPGNDILEAVMKQYP